MSNWEKNNKYTKSENRYKSKLDIKENVIEKSDADARLLDVMGNRSDYYYLFAQNKQDNRRNVSILTNINQNEELFKEVTKLDNSKTSTTVYVNNKKLKEKEDSSIRQEDAYTEIQVERYDILKSIDHTDCGLNAAILEHQKSDGENEIILWADGSKGLNNFWTAAKDGIISLASVFEKIFPEAVKQKKQENSPQTNKQTSEDKQNQANKKSESEDDISIEPLGFWATVRELVQDWLGADLATVFGIVNKQTKHLREFAMEYMYGHIENPKRKTDAKTDKYIDKPRIRKIDRAIGVSLSGIALSTLGFTKGFEDTEISAYSGGTTKKVHDNAIKLWGDNGLGGANITNFFTPREALSQLIKYYKKYNKFFIQEQSGAPDKTQHGANVYTHNDGKDMRYSEMDYKPQAVFWPWHISTPIDTLRYKFTSPPEKNIQDISNIKRKKSSGKNKTSFSFNPAVNFSDGISLDEDFLLSDIGNFLNYPPPGVSEKHSRYENKDFSQNFYNKIDTLEQYLLAQPKILQMTQTGSADSNLILQNTLMPITHSYTPQTTNTRTPSVSETDKSIQPTDNFELREQVEEIVTNILDDFIIRIGYNMHDYN